ncbi:YjfI family protein [Simiduia sp. 21SJ11W-1]|uniref:YjfI family protein n=1 Tax=Simiduia sp. 21SJ11W-1 TaxID=2909669 RepID=UPI0020A0EB57|nr:YjfI family protein [Simiduia sp. 21SJ11W-1]UTA48051.1 YjfI family protein [Simiduia sp. 21SJ11W-1]
MKAKSSAHYQREFRKRLREMGLVKKEVWIRPEYAKQLQAIEKQLREPGMNPNAGVMDMEERANSWSTAELHKALGGSGLNAEVEFIDGVEPAIHLSMNDYGDLPVFLTVVGDQVIVESVLWSVNDVQDVHAFNETVLRTHKYFPLSTVSLDNLGDDGDYYHMFGALSATSSLQNIIFEIEVLASNVIQATEAYSEHLK